MNLAPPPHRLVRDRRAFTLAEMMIVMGLIVIIGGAMILCNLFGLSMSMRQEIWMDATSDTARTVGKLMTDVRSAQILEVGNYVNGSFVQVPNFTNQWGDAIRIFIATNAFATSTNSPPWIDYYYSSSTSNLMRTNWEGPGVPGSATEVCANPITNDNRIFTMEDSLGNTNFTTTTISVVEVYLSYIKFQNPQITISPGGLVDLLLGAHAHCAKDSMKITWKAGHARRSQNGWALLVTMSIATAGMISLAGVMNWCAENSELAARNNEYFQTAYAAEAATEKALAALSTDFQNYNLGIVAQHVSTYQTMIPSSSDDPTGKNYWANYNFGSGSNVGNMVVTETMSQTTNVLGPPYAGLKMVGVTYEIIANAEKKNSQFGIETTVGQAINIGTIPLFQFTVFYQNDMEVNPGATMNIGGLVHGNANIYTGVGGGALTYSNSVTAVGNVYSNQAAADPTARSAPNVNFQTPFSYGQNPINLPVGTNMAGSGVNSSANVYAILQVPNSSEGPGTAIGTNMLYNQADLIVLVSNNSVTVQTGPMASSAINVASNIFTNFITTNAFTDQRQGLQMNGVVLNVSNLNNWVSTNQALYTSLGHELDSVYVADERGNSNFVVTNVPVLPSAFSTHYPTGSFQAPPYTNSQSYTVSTNPATGSYIGLKVHNSNGTYTANFVTGFTYTNLVTQTNWVQTSQPAVYLTNGAVLPSNGLSVATPDPAYVAGNWNVKTSKTGASDAGQNSTVDSLPSGIYADAVTILSPSWNPNNSAMSIGNRVASSDTVNAAILTGNVPSNGAYYSGGVENFVRFLEDWSSQTFWYNGSLVCMFPSQIATGHWPGTGSVYNPPTRDWCFDQNFNNPNKMPPLMPQTRAVVRGRWATLVPGSTSF